ncbi:TonB-dependent receptor [Aquirufa nivalisilvae]|uniref:TonB-dependent receptor n=1 Tax=Aquirufa nivalisilvae TaxID=2516557 RepID=UPI0022A9A358|nr:TonB-dependent receptor [Aquirufa nivalisilvae]MCZ2482896.1 TonB-dependent receptor [Aquirufa nivalisilvae]
MKLKSQILFFFLLLLFHESYSQKNCFCTLQGKVSSIENREKIKGAYVYLKGTNFAVQTDSLGFFSLKKICPGSYTLVCEMSSYDPVEIKVNLSNQHEENIALHVHDEHLQEVVVSGKRNETSAQMRGSLSAEERKERDGLNLGEMLKGISGVQSLQTGSTISKPVIHGMHSSRVIILNQGVRQEGQNWGSEHAPEVDPFVSKNIQVIKGPAGLRYGGDAIGGIVMLEPNALPDTNGIKGELQSIYFTNGRQLVGSGSVEGGFKGGKGWGWRVQGTIKNGGNIHSANYYLANTGVQEQNFSTQIGYKSRQFGADIFYSRFHTVIGIFLGSHIGNVNDLERSIALSRPLEQFTPNEFIRDIDRPNQDVNHDMLKFKSFYQVSSQYNLRLTLAHQTDERLELDVLRAGKNINTLSFQLSTWNGELLLDGANSSQLWKGQFGLTFSLQDNITSGNRVNSPTLVTSLLPNYEQNNVGLFAIERMVKEKWELELGLRLDQKQIITHRPIKNYSFIIDRDEKSFTGVSGSAGLKYHWLDNLESHFILARAFRAPGANELFSNGVHHGAAAYEIGQPNLKGETATNISLNTQYNVDKWDIELGLYSNHIQDFIYLRPMVNDGQAVYIITLRGIFPGFTYEQINARFNGLDGQISYHINPKISLQQKTSIVRAFNTKNMEYMVNIPADRFEYLIRYQFNHNKQYVSAGVTQVSRQSRVEPGSDYAVPPAGYQLVQLNWGYQFKNLDVGIRITNALNESYRDYLNRFRYYTDDQGRNIQLRVAYKFS